jgi:hypothetical protein
MLLLLPIGYGVADYCPLVVTRRGFLRTAAKPVITGVPKGEGLSISDISLAMSLFRIADIRVCSL